jgi:hypothetical protein
MGFKAKKKLYKLIFADEDMDGLEVTMTSVPMGDLMSLQQLDPKRAAQDPEEFRKLLGIFAGAMLSWNLVDDNDVAVPITVDAFLEQDIDFIFAIIDAWSSAVGGVSAPLDDGSTSGANALEASMPMDALSPNPSS